MILSKYFFPDLRYRTVNDINIESLLKRGIKYAILDIDNTLVPYTSPKPDENAMIFLNKLKDSGIKFCFVSNNNIHRINVFNENIVAPAYPNAKKPLLFGINLAMSSFGAVKENTVMIGDQVFTDVCAGKRAEILTILVEPIKEVDSLFFRFKRHFERKIIKAYESSIRGKIDE